MPRNFWRWTKVVALTWLALNWLDPAHDWGDPPFFGPFQATSLSAQTTSTVTGGCPTSRFVNAVGVNVPGLACAQPQAADLSGLNPVAVFGAACTASGSTPQTCNGSRGVVTTGTLTTAAVTDAAFTINDSSVVAASVVMCTDLGYSGTLVTNGIPVITTCVPGTGTITVHITNVHASNAMNGTVAIGFTVQ